MAAGLRRELGIEVDLVDGPYGQATVLVDGDVVARTGLSGWLPRTRTIVERVSARLGTPSDEPTAEPPGGPIASAGRAGWVAGLAALALYTATTRGTVGCADAAEFQTLAATGGIAHAGYPACVMLLEAFGRLPFGSIALRANLLSCLSGAIAVGFAARVAARLTRSPLAGVLAALAFGLSMTFWNESTFAGVHAFTMAIGAVLFALLLSFADQPSGPRAFAIGALAGLGAVSHLTALALGLPLLAGLLATARDGRLRGSHATLLLAGLLVGLAPLAYLLARDAPGQAMNYIADTLRPSNVADLAGARMPRTRLERLAWLLSARQYLHAPGDQASGGALVQLRILVLTLFLNDLPLLGVPLALAGLAWLWVRQRRAGATLTLWLAGVVILVLLADLRQMTRIFFIPGLWVLAQALAAGLAAVQRRSVAAFAAAAALLLAAPLVRLTVSAPPAPLAGHGMVAEVWRQAPADWSPFRPDRTWDAFGREVMTVVEPGALVLSCWREATTLRYFRYAERLRQDVEVRYACHDPRPELPDAERDRRPVYVTYFPAAEARDGRELVPVGPWPVPRLWRLAPLASTPGAR